MIFSNIEDIFVNYGKLFFKGKNKTGDFHSLPQENSSIFGLRLKAPSGIFLQSSFIVLLPHHLEPRLGLSLFSELASMTVEPVLVV